MRVRLVGLAVSVLLLSAACGRPDGTSPDLIDPLTSAGESVTVAGDCGSELAGTLRAWAGSACGVWRSQGQPPSTLRA